MKFNITTYSAQKLIKKYQVKSGNGTHYIYFGINHNDPRALRHYVKSTEEYNDTALFYQIREVVKAITPEITWNDDSLQKYLIFIDFQSVFDHMPEKTDKREVGDTFSEEDLHPIKGKVSYEYKARSLFEKGLHISYGNNTIIDYVPFDKSSSMSRAGKMSFVNKDILKELNKRLNLGMTFANQTVNLSKYYAYKGLYLSEAVRIDFEKDVLNDETVIVVPDAWTKRKNQRIITAEETWTGSNTWKTKEVTEDFKIEEVFDGEGLISRDLARKINEKAHFDGATSFQIRMPFIKGMLHSVDFHAIVREYLGDLDSYMIKDLFGVERDLMKAQIVIPASMFKCKNWLENELGEKDSCMKYYFEKFYEYNHALYISNTDLAYGKNSLTKLNYQILNTLALDKEEFEELVQNHLYWANHPVEYLEKIDFSDDDEEYDTRIEESKTEEVWKFALKHNKVFAHEGKIRGLLQSVSEGLKYDCARGKLIVSGEVRYLSRDLLAFVLELIKDSYADDEKFKELKDSECLFKEYFYMPQNRINLEANKHYPIFRNPHLSRNEQCALIPYVKGRKAQKNDMYYKYFSHLRGVVMVAYNSLVPQTLGGADFDGDIVKIIDDNRIRHAVLRGVYHDYKRVLPIIKIPSVDSRGDLPVTDETKYEIIRDTFSNKIGQISNLSIRLGSKEYESVNGKQEKLEHSCAECTILTGLEIDAAKTGAHPYLVNVIEYGNRIKPAFDYVSDFKTQIDELSERQYFISTKQIKTDGSRYELKKHINDINPLICYTWTPDMRGVDCLPKYFMESIGSKPVLPGTELKEKGRYIYFDFLRYDEWKKSVDLDIQAKVGAVMKAYYQIEKNASNIYKYRRKLKTGKYESFVKTILNLQYDFEDEEEIDDALAELWAHVDEALDSKESVDEVLRLVNENNWAFLLPEQKDDALRRILGDDVEQKVASILKNFDARGYNLLFYALKDVSVLRSKEMTDEDIFAEVEEDINLDDVTIDADYYIVFYENLRKAFISWKNEKKTNWKKLAIKKCMQEINDLTSNLKDREKLLYLYWSLNGYKKPDKAGKFFWEFVTADDILEHLA